MALIRFVTALMPPPVKPLSRTSNGATATLNCSMASSGMGLACVSEPVMPVVPKPYTSSLAMPSMRNELYRVLAPATLTPPALGDTI